MTPQHVGIKMQIVSVEPTDFYCAIVCPHFSTFNLGYHGAYRSARSASEVSVRTDRNTKHCQFEQRQLAGVRYPHDGRTRFVTSIRAMILIKVDISRCQK